MFPSDNTVTLIRSSSRFQSDIVSNHVQGPRRKPGLRYTVPSEEFISSVQSMTDQNKWTVKHCQTLVIEGEKL